MSTISLDLHLYGALASYVTSDTPGYANLQVSLPENSNIGDLLIYLGIPTGERGITFINGNLSALPGLQPDLEQVLHNNDRVAFFDLKSMWPFQYRQGAMMTNEMSRKIYTDDSTGIRHTFE